VNDALEKKRPVTGSGRRPVTLLQENARPNKTKKDSGNHRKLRLGNSSSCGVFSKFGPF